jgi:2-haloacid dehalogenase
MTTSFPWLLFDVDDTLFDFRAAEARALEQAFEGAGIAFDAAWLPVYREVNARTWRALEEGRISPERLRVERFVALFEQLGLDLDPDTFGDRYLQGLRTQAQLVPGATAVLDVVLPGRRLALVTNGLADVQRPRLAASAIVDRIDVVVISEEEGVAKPDPAIFEIALERMGRPARGDVLVIGDSLSSDIAGGIGAGLATAWYNPAGSPPSAGIRPTYEIASLADLIGILGSAPPGGDRAKPDAPDARRHGQGLPSTDAAPPA